jgi:hypothetical protein
MQTRHLVSLVPNRLALANERVAFVAPLVFDVALSDPSGCEASAALPAIASQTTTLTARHVGSAASNPLQSPVPGPLRRTIDI